MKKFQKMCAVLAALALGLICFAGCSNDAGGSSGGGGNVSNNGGGNSNNEDEETPAITVVAKYVAEDNKSLYYIFYSNKEYEYIERGNIIDKGTYYGEPTKTTTIVFEVKYKWNDNAEQLISTSKSYERKINKDSDGDLYFWDVACYAYFYLE